jgi:copper chaperone CopZ
MFRLVFFIFLLSGITTLIANNPEELGKVRWHRDLEEATQIAAKEKKPILILFQEIPGCLTCKTYGKVVLSHPLIVETIETYFVPLAIYNNRNGKDASVLAYYREPSWNNPVVRIVGQDKSDLLPRLNGNYTPSGLVNYLINGMTKAGYPIPNYLPLLHEELSAMERGVKKTTLSMYCFWTGEKELGKIDGVVQTEAGFMDRREVVNVYYDPEIVSLSEILIEGQKSQCADRAYVSDEYEKGAAKTALGADKVTIAGLFKMDKEPKYYLSKTDFQWIPMSPIQAVKMNALIGQGKSPLHLLSPRQQLMHHYLQKNKSVKWLSKINDQDWEAKMYQAWEELGYRA